MSDDGDFAVTWDFSDESSEYIRQLMDSLWRRREAFVDELTKSEQAAARDAVADLFDARLRAGKAWDDLARKTLDGGAA